MRGQQDPRLDDYLGHMRDAIGRIERYMSGLDEAEFVAGSSPGISLAYEDFVRGTVHEASEAVLR